MIIGAFKLQIALHYQDQEFVPRAVVDLGEGGRMEFTSFQRIEQNGGGNGIFF